MQIKRGNFLCPEKGHSAKWPICSQYWIYFYLIFKFFGMKFDKNLVTLNESAQAFEQNKQDNS